MEKMLQSRWSFVVACLCSGGLLLGAYANHFHNAFHFDDDHVIVSNLYIRSLWNVPRFFVDGRMFSTLPANAVYRPLLSATFALDYWLSGRLDPWQFHITQFAMLLLLGAGLVGLFVRLMDVALLQWWNRYLALGAAALFCLHTANTETVNYISSRSDLLSTLAVVSAFVWYLFFPRSRRCHVYLCPMVLGALAKPPAVMFAPLFLVFLLFFAPQLSCTARVSVAAWPRLRSALQQALPACLLGVALFWLINAMNASTVNYGGGTRWQYLLTQTFVWLHYLRLFLVPLGLTADTDWQLIPQWYDTRVVVGLVGLSFLARLVWRCVRPPAWRPVAYGIIWFGVGLLPTSSLVPLAEVLNEHRIFLPYIGLSLAVVWALALGMRHGYATWSWFRPVVLPVALLMAVLVLGGHALGTSQRNLVWASEETLWQDVVQKSPANGRAWMNYGLTQMAQGKYVQAKNLFERAALYTPNYPSLEVNLGLVKDRLGEPAVAEQHLRRALQLQPDFVAGHYYYARWLLGQGRAGEATLYLRRAIELSPGWEAARRLLLDLYTAQGAEAEAKTLAGAGRATVAPAAPLPAVTETAGEPPSGSAQQYYNQGLALTQTEQHLAAALTYRRALQLDPNSAEAYNNLGWSLAKLGLYQEAIPAFEQALRLRPDFALAGNNLAWARGQVTAAGRPR